MVGVGGKDGPRAGVDEQMGPRQQEQIAGWGALEPPPAELLRAAPSSTRPTHLHAQLLAVATVEHAPVVGIAIHLAAAEEKAEDNEVRSAKTSVDRPTTQRHRAAAHGGSPKSLTDSSAHLVDRSLRGEEPDRD